LLNVICSYLFTLEQYGKFRLHFDLYMTGSDIIFVLKKIIMCLFRYWFCCNLCNCSSCVLSRSCSLC